MEIIKLKGTGDGVKIYLSNEIPFSEQLTAVQEKLRAWRKFFGSGHCNMYFLGRELNRSDTLRLEAVVHALLPESTILYGERKNMGDTVKLPPEFVREMKRQDALREAAGKKELDEDSPAVSSDNGEGEAELESTRQFNQIREVVTSNFKSSRARLFEGGVRDGRTVESDGHLVLVGNVEKGGTLIANGNVIVMGRLEGSVQAGCMGNREAYIIALDMNPTDLRIAHAYLRCGESGDTAEYGGLKRAYVINNSICVDEFLLNM